MNQENQNQEFSFESIASEFSMEAPGAPMQEFTLDTTEETPTEEEFTLDTTTPEGANPEEKEGVLELQTEKKEESTLQSFNYDNAVKNLLSSGAWEDVMIETEEGVEVKLSELKDIPEEEFLKLVEDQKAIKEEDVKEKYLTVDGLSEDKKRIIDILAKGGDLKEIFKTPQALVKPYTEESGWDLDNEEHQKQIAHNKYRRLGHSDDKARALVAIDMKNLELDSVAREEVKLFHEDYDSRLKQISEDLEKEKIEKVQKLKNYKGDLTKEYKTDGIPDATIKKLIDVATKENQEGVLLVDELYEKMIEDPKQAKELLFFMVDKEKYLAEKTKKEVEKVQIQNMRTIRRIPKEVGRSNSKEDAPKDKDAFEFEIIKT